jgi:taurine dioxygenase
LRIKPLSEHVGAEISGVNLAADLPDDIFEKIDDAYNRHSVLVFRGQKLTPEQQRSSRSM